MYKEVQKKLSRNWFKILQDVICNEIEILEKRSTKFASKNWNKNVEKILHEQIFLDFFS